MSPRALEKVDRPATFIAVIAAVALCAYVLLLPLTAADTPMLTDLPFHTATAAGMLHYFDPAWHFQEQFELRPFSVPYVSFYGLMAILMTVFSPLVATRIAIALLFALLPMGFATLAWGMKKSPLLGLLALFPVWGVLTHWGFVNHMAALGMFAAAIGLALRLTQQPSRGIAWLLGLTLVLILCTHVYRFPFAWAASLGAGLFMWPDKEKLRPLVWPLAISLALFAIWLIIRPSSIGLNMRLVWPQWGRFGEFELQVWDALKGDHDRTLYHRALMILGAAAGGLTARAIVRRIRNAHEPWDFAVRSHLLVAGCFLVVLFIYLTFPLWIGGWFFVYPRAGTTAIFLLFALVPDLPRHGLAQLGFVAIIAISMVPITRDVAEAHVEFAESLDGMWTLSDELPQAPKLAYLIFDHSGSKNHVSPYVHVPAYLQAIHGGWLSWHFAGLGGSPLTYRDREEEGAVLPPETTSTWIWRPRDFKLGVHGTFFDWFLVRSKKNPARRFRKDPTIVLAGREGRWWLFKREAPAVIPGDSERPPIEPSAR